MPTFILNKIPEGTSKPFNKERFTFTGGNWISDQTHKIAPKHIAYQLEFETIQDMDAISDLERRRMAQAEAIKSMHDSPAKDPPGTKAIASDGHTYTFLGMSWIQDGTNKIATKKIADELNLQGRIDPVIELLGRASRRDFQKKTKEAMNWYIGQAQRYQRIKPRDMFHARKDDIKNNTYVGHMYFYQYDAKHKATLPYWDKWPLIFIIHRYDDGFLGINLHYLPIRLRAILLKKLYDLSSSQKLTEKTKLRITYGVLKSSTKYKEFKPCIKRYLTSHVQSRFLRIDPREWTFAIFLPLQRFQKASVKKVWADSAEMINK